MFISRWDVAVTGKVPENLRNQLGIAIATRTYAAYCSLLDSPRYRRIREAGVRPQRLLWASTGTKDPSASDLLYIEALAAPFTVNTMPEGTLNALAEHGAITRILPAHGGDCEELLTRFARAGIDIDALAAQLQDEGAEIVRQVLERAVGLHRIQERGAEMTQSAISARGIEHLEPAASSRRCVGAWSMRGSMTACRPFTRCCTRGTSRASPSRC